MAWKFSEKGCKGWVFDGKQTRVGGKGCQVGMVIGFIQDHYLKSTLEAHVDDIHFLLAQYFQVTSL